MRFLTPHRPILDPPGGTRDLTVTLTERERRSIGGALELVEEIADANGFDTTAVRELRGRLTEGLER